MLTNPKPMQDPQIRFIFDHLVDSVKDQSMLLWEALDTHTKERVWIIGRRVSETKVMPLAKLLPDTRETVSRYAPSLMDGTWDMSQITGIIKP